MRRFIDEDETPAAKTGRRSRASDVRHGFGSPDGMELKNFAAESQNIKELQEEEVQSQQPFVRSGDHEERKEYHNILALADNASPPPILTMSTESETPTPPALKGGRKTPADVADALIRGVTSSPVRDLVADRLTSDQNPTYPQSPLPGMFASPSTSFVSTSSSHHHMVTPSMPTFRPESKASPIAVPTTMHNADQVQTGSLPRFAHLAMTPGRDNYVSDMDDSVSGSDTSVKEPFSDQVKSLNKLLLSTGKRLGEIGQTSWTPDQDNDNLTKEEEDLEEVRRQLQEELSKVDFTLLKDSPGGTPSMLSTRSSSTHRVSPTNESPSFALEWPQLDQSIFGTPASIDDPYRSAPSADRNFSPVTPSTISTVWGTESVSPDNQISLPLSRRRVLKSGRSSRVPFLSQTEDSSAWLTSSQLSTDPSKVLNSIERPPPEMVTSPSKADVTPRITPTDFLHYAQIHTNSIKMLEPTSPPSPRPATSTWKVTASPGSTLTGTVDSVQLRSYPINDLKPTAPPPSGPATSSLKVNVTPQRTPTGMPELSEETETQMPLPGIGSSVYPSRGTTSSATGKNPILSFIPMSPNDLNTESVESSAPTSSDSSSWRPDCPAHNVHSSDYFPGTIEHSREVNDLVSTSASEDSGSFEYGPLLDEESQQKLSPTPINSLLSSEINRKEIAPEPPQADVDYTTSKTTSPDKADYQLISLSSDKPLAECKILTGVDSLSTMARIQDQLIPPPTNFRSTVMGDHPIPSNVTAVCKDTVGDLKRLPAQFHYPGRSSSNLKSREFPNDEREFEVRNSSRKEKKTPSVRFLAPELMTATSPPLVQTMTSDNNSTNRDDDVDLNKTLQTISTKFVFSSILRKNREKDERVHHQVAESPTKTYVQAQSQVGEASAPLDHSKMPFSNSATRSEGEYSLSEDISQKGAVKSPKMVNRCNFLPFLPSLLVVVAFFILLFLVGGLGPDNANDSPISVSSPQTMPTVRPSVSNLAPSMSTLPSETPTSRRSQSPTTVSSSAPTPPSIIFPVTFESVYEIFIRDGLTSDVPHEMYENDLVVSMDRLLVKTLASLPWNHSPKLLRRHFATSVLPSEINRFQTIACPTPDSINKCEKVFANITLEGARHSWTDVKISVELAIASGQLQLELEQVNPSSPVDILDLIEDLEPSPIPLDNLSPTPWKGSLIPTVPPSSTGSFPPSVVPTIAPSMSSSTNASQVPGSSYLLDLLTNFSFDGGVALRTVGSAQYKAYLWLLENSFLHLYSDGRLLQRFALATFFYSTHGEGWFLRTDWLSDTDECSWYSRSPRAPCDQFGSFQSLELDYNNLNGRVPPELGLLSNSLERVLLRGGPSSFTSGTLPTELGYLTKMTLFHIRENHFSGSLPAQLGQWTALEQLDISSNRFTGTIPPSVFASAVGATSIDVSKNRLTGSLPIEVGKLEKCQRFNIENNMISGDIPTEIGALSRLQSFHGGSNALSSLPSEIGRLTYLDTLALQQNNISGAIPSELSRIPRLFILDLSFNLLSGTIPSRTHMTRGIPDKY
jgi:hypothetical protein